MLNVSPFKQPELMFGFWGERRGKKKPYSSIGERSKMPIPSTLRNVEMSHCKKTVLVLAVSWHGWKWISITASKGIHLKSKTYRHVVCISNDTYQAAPARPCHLEQNIFVLQPHRPQRLNPRFLISTTKSVH